VAGSSARRRSLSRPPRATAPGALARLRGPDRAASLARRARPHRPEKDTATMTSLLGLVDTIITLYIWCLIISAVLSWLVAFNVVNTSNRFVFMLGDFLYRITEPALRPVRQFLPSLGGIDISPVVVILLLIFARSLLFEYWPH
jgi:YggT family protein